MGEGHLYQGRNKRFPVERDEHLRPALRYVEANPVRAGMARRARDWASGNLTARVAGGDEAAWLGAWPVDRPLDGGTLDALRVSVARGRPFGSPARVGKTAAALGVEGHAMPGRVHLRPGIPPKFSVAHASGASSIKGRGAVRVRREPLRERRTVGLHFRAVGYRVGTAGLDERAVRQYTREQEKLDGGRGAVRTSSNR